MSSRDVGGEPQLSGQVRQPSDARAGYALLQSTSLDVGFREPEQSQSAVHIPDMDKEAHIPASSSGLSSKVTSIAARCCRAHPPPRSLARPLPLRRPAPSCTLTRPAGS